MTRIDAGDGLLEGMGTKDYDISEKGLEWAKKAIDGTKEGFDINSPSKKMETVGKNSGEGLVNGMDSKLVDIGNAAKRMVSAVLNKFNSLNTDMWNKGVEAARNFRDGFQAVYIPTPHMYISSWSSHNVGNGNTMQTPNFSVDWYAVGGLFRTPTIAGIGEAGAEAVLPLENRRTMSMIADSILSNASAGVDDESLTNAVARGVAMAMMNNQGNIPNIIVNAELRTENDEVLARAVTRGQQRLDYRNNAVATV